MHVAGNLGLREWSVPSRFKVIIDFLKLVEINTQLGNRILIGRRHRLDVFDLLVDSLDCGVGAAGELEQIINRHAGQIDRGKG